MDPNKIERGKTPFRPGSGFECAPKIRTQIRTPEGSSNLDRSQRLPVIGPSIEFYLDVTSFKRLRLVPNSRGRAGTLIAPWTHSACLTLMVRKNFLLCPLYITFLLRGEQSDFQYISYDTYDIRKRIIRIPDTRCQP